MIKLIASDIDGTLIEESTPDLYPEMAEEIRSLGVGKVIKIDDLSLFFFHNDSPICHLARQHLFTAGPPKAFSISFLQTAAALKQICCYFL